MAICIVLLIRLIIASTVCVAQRALPPNAFRTTSGIMHGIALEQRNRRVIQLLGVPFAEPPVGNLRFQRPKKYQPSSADAYKDASKRQPMCIQFLKLADAGVPDSMRPGVGQSEDCLYLDIYIGSDYFNGAQFPMHQHRLFGFDERNDPFDRRRPFNSGRRFGDVHQFERQLPERTRFKRQAVERAHPLRPRVVPRVESGLKPIMVFFHGGGFLFGSGSMYNGTYLALGGDVIVVTVNYRLGPLGFLTMMNDELPSNVALWDQHLALQWLRENARAIGGDPHRVTIFGESTGAMSVSAHVLSPHSRLPAGVDSGGAKTLFRRAIMQSGSIINNLYDSDASAAVQRARRFARHARCGSDDDDQLAICIRRMPIRQLRDLGRLHRELNFGVVVDGDFLPYSPLEMMLDGNFNREIELLVGFNSDEGSVAISNMRYKNLVLRDVDLPHAVASALQSTLLQRRQDVPSAHRRPYQRVDRATADIVARFVAHEYRGDRQEFFEDTRVRMRRDGVDVASLRALLRGASDRVFAGGGLLDFRFDADANDASRYQFGRALLPPTGLQPAEVESITNLRRMMDITKDALIEAPAINFANLAAHHGAEAFVYYFNHELSFEFFPRPKYMLRGASHAEELPFVFGMLLDDFVATDDEQLLSLYIIDSWTNFAKTGWVTVSTLFEKIDMLSNPSFSDDLGTFLPPWLPWRPDDHEPFFMNLTTRLDQSSLQLGYRARRMRFWNDLIPRLVDTAGADQGICPRQTPPPLDTDLRPETRHLSPPPRRADTDFRPDTRRLSPPRRTDTDLRPETRRLPPPSPALNRPPLTRRPDRRDPFPPPPRNTQFDRRRPPTSATNPAARRFRPLDRSDLPNRRRLATNRQPTRFSSSSFFPLPDRARTSGTEFDFLNARNDLPESAIRRERRQFTAANSSAEDTINSTRSSTILSSGNATTTITTTEQSANASTETSTQPPTTSASPVEPPNISTKRAIMSTRPPFTLPLPLPLPTAHLCRVEISKLRGVIIGRLLTTRQSELLLLALITVVILLVLLAGTLAGCASRRAAPQPRMQLKASDIGLPLPPAIGGRRAAPPQQAIYAEIRRS